MRAKIVLHLIQVGGIRNERKKWIHCCFEVSSVFYVVNIGWYNHKLREDDTVFDLNESLMLFTEIVNNRFFQDTSQFYLVFNGYDMLKSRLCSHPFVHFDYLGQQTAEQVITFAFKVFCNAVKDEMRLRQVVKIVTTFVNEEESTRFVKDIIKHETNKNVFSELGNIYYYISSNKQLFEQGRKKFACDVTIITYENKKNVL